MVFNIYGDRNYNDAEIYNGIRNNPELNNFFISLTQPYNKMSEAIKSEELKKLEEQSPNLDEVINLISLLRKTGITISDENCLLSAIAASSASRLHISLPFSLVKFNDISFWEKEFNFFRLSDANSKTIPRELKDEYKDWNKRNRNIDKEIEKLQKRILKNNNDSKQFLEDSNRLYNFKNNIERCERLKSKIEFIQNLTTEQRVFFGELYKISKDKQEEFIQFEIKKSEMLRETDKKINDNINLVYDEFINSRSTTIDIDLIIEKLFKVILMSVLKEFKLQYTKEPTPEVNMNLEDLKKEVIEWFVNQNSEKFREMFDLAFEDLECITNALVKKQNKKI